MRQHYMFNSVGKDIGVIASQLLRILNRILMASEKRHKPCIRKLSTTVVAKSKCDSLLSQVEPNEARNFSIHFNRNTVEMMFRCH